MSTFWIQVYFKSNLCNQCHYIFLAHLKNVGDFKKVGQHHRMPTKGIVCAMASSTNERDDFSIGLCVCLENTKNPKWKLHFSSHTLVDFVSQKSSSISHCPEAKWDLKQPCLSCLDPFF